MRILILLLAVLALRAETPAIQTTLTPEEHDAYVLLYLQDLSVQNSTLNKLSVHKAGFEDLDASDKAHAERVRVLKQLAKEHHACEGADYNIAKKDWACPEKGKN